jgi:hypothetical protein
MIDLILGALVGAAGRYIYGGHVKAIPTQVAYALFFALGVVLLIPGDLIAAAVVSFAAAIGWNPGHGSYADAGSSANKDDEDVRPLTRIIAAALGAKDDRSLFYDGIGMSVRYGLSTVVTGLAMLACNVWLGSGFALWYALVGLSAGPVLAILAAVVKDPQRRWVAFELSIGAIIYAGLGAAA